MSYLYSERLKVEILSTAVITELQELYNYNYIYIYIYI